MVSSSINKAQIQDHKKRRVRNSAREVEAILKEAPDLRPGGYIAEDIMEPGSSAETLFLNRKAGLLIDEPGPTN